MTPHKRQHKHKKIPHVDQRIMSLKTSHWILTSYLYKQHWGNRSVNHSPVVKNADMYWKCNGVRSE